MKIFTSCNESELIGAEYEFEGVQIHKIYIILLTILLVNASVDL